MKDDTLLVHQGKDPFRHDGIVNLPVYRASTVLFPTMESFNNRAAGDRKYRGVRYGASETIRRKVLDQQATFPLQDAHSLYQVFHLPHVTGPVVCL